MEELQITIEQPVVRFDSFEYYKNECLQIAQVIKDKELTDDNMKECKKLLADGRKLTKALNDKRIQIKKQILEPYNRIESQVGELTEIINAADYVLRNKVRKLEEQYRQEKENQLHEIWDKRITHYNIEDYINDAFYKWLTPQHLNQTYSINKAESDMVDWIQTKQDEITFILSSENNQAVMIEYNDNGLDFMKAYNTVEDRMKRASEVKLNSQVDKKTFTIIGEDNIKLIEQFLKDNNIAYYN